MAAIESSHWWYVGTREICLSMLAPYLATGRRLRILDIGCGTGGNLLALSAYGDARGVDPDSLCVSYCREKGLAVTSGSMSELHAPAGSLDVVTLFDVLTQADRDEAEPTLRRIHDALAKDGILAFREPAMPIARGAHDRAVNVRHRYTAAEIGRMLDRTGFTPLRVTYLNTLLFPPIVVARLLQRRFRPSYVASDVEPAPVLLNAALLALLRIERRLLAHGDLPFGVSVFAIARKRNA
jgi:SAM-dependent methyltransferase